MTHQPSTSHKNINVPVDTRQFISLCDFLKSKKSSKDPVDVISEAIDYWMENADWKIETLMSEAIKGYHWKNVFLPNGTSLRMKYKGEYYYAAVQGDNIIYESQSISPSEFCNLVTQTSRNAWNDVWIKRPNDSEWIFADTIRKEIA